MTRSWILAGLIACGLLSVWLMRDAGRAASPASLFASRRAAAADPTFADIGRAAGQLRARLAAAPRPTALHRNPFAFRGGDGATPGAAGRKAAVLAAASLPPARPEMHLIGIARDVSNGQPVRIALISLMNQLVLAKEGDSLLSRYKVTRVTEDAVQLADGDQPFTLTLK